MRSRRSRSDIENGERPVAPSLLLSLSKGIAECSNSRARVPCLSLSVPLYGDVDGEQYDTEQTGTEEWTQLEETKKD